jgi:hypothetical protein
VQILQDFGVGTAARISTLTEQNSMYQDFLFQPSPSGTAQCNFVSLASRLIVS